MSIERFKEFARLHPELVKSVESNKTTWQKLYEMYDIYGENSSVWENYMTSSKPVKDATLGDIVTTIKNVDLDSVQKGIQNLQKTIALIEDLVPSGVASNTSNYEARPMYKYFED